MDRNVEVIQGASLSDAMKDISSIKSSCHMNSIALELPSLMFKDQISQVESNS